MAMHERQFGALRDRAATEAYFSREQQLRGLGWNDEDAARYAALYQVKFDSALSPHEREVATELEKKYNAQPQFGVFEDEKTVGE